MALFKEYELRVVSIASNPYARIYKYKTERVLAELKAVVNFYTYWRDVQKYWAYLLPVFKQKDIATNMPAQKELFIDVDQTYREDV